MKSTFVNIISPKQCKYKYDGVNLAEMRRAAIYKIARRFNIPDGPKNDMLKALIPKLDLLEASEELTET